MFDNACNRFIATAMRRPIQRHSFRMGGFLSLQWILDQPVALLWNWLVE